MSHLSDAGKALEIVDAQLVAIQSRTAGMRATLMDNTYASGQLADIVDLLDLIIGDVRGAGVDIASHVCTDAELQRKYDELLRINRELADSLRES